MLSIPSLLIDCTIATIHMSVHKILQASRCIKQTAGLKHVVFCNNSTTVRIPNTAWNWSVVVNSKQAYRMAIRWEELKPWNSSTSMEDVLGMLFAQLIIYTHFSFTCECDTANCYTNDSHVFWNVQTWTNHI